VPYILTKLINHRPFADDCIIYRKITKNEDIVIFQKDLDRLGEWAVVRAMRIS
jgi:hypothetical protein